MQIKEDKEYLSDLNEAQKAPVIQKEGPLIVIAGAGSGKTRVLTYRIAYLMDQGIDPFSILALTFTNKAAREMKDRISKVVGQSEAMNLWMGTFHSVFARILRAESNKLGYPSNFTIYDTQDSERLISSIIKEKNFDKDLYKYKQIRSRISTFKNNLITVNAYFNNPELMEADLMSKRPKIGEIYKEYVERTFKAGVMDFDDLLLKTNELLNKFPDVLAKYQERFKYILVDEYQDTNHSQYLIVKALSDRYQNICVVGDDSQSIYSFRGANINNILNFQKDYEDVNLYRLEQNYRSTKNIVNLANSVIKHNLSKIEKSVWTHNDNGEKILVSKMHSDAEEGRYVASKIEEIKTKNLLKNKDFAILYRTNAQSRAIEDSLRKKSIPYRIYGGLSFYKRKEIKDVLAYLRLIINPKDEESLKRIINYPARGIGQSTLDKLIFYSNENNISIYESISDSNKIKNIFNKGVLERLSKFYFLIEMFRIENQKLNAFEICDLVFKKSGIIQELKKDFTPESLTRIENIEELLNGIRDFIEGQVELADADTSLANFIQDISLVTDFDINNNYEKDEVSLMTIHLSKGLEFPYVFIVGLEEDLFPSALSLNSRSELEEERRLFYVALTRAEKQAFLSYTLSRYRWGKIIDVEASRFIEEMDTEYLEFNNNEETFFPSYGGTRKKEKKINSLSNFYTTNNKRLKTINNVGKISDFSIKNNSLKINQEVSHERFGYGIIIGIDGKGKDKIASIDFKGIGVKKLLLRFAKLKTS
ncbi:MAG: ATP-dependent DNA helicase [Flavobacteriaceae bacterium]|nr:ATP-dependent DNA helicase [Flavobacteriaceae bacterium]|tara:strand:+ start:45821 stop:48109 length:2289 start_codon:yes stop_codon:yes gene_type:complete